MVYLFFAFVFALLVAIFAIQNSLPVAVSFFYWSAQTSLVILILGSATFGAMVILLLATYVQIKQRLTLRRARQRQEELEAEVNALRAKLEQDLTNDQTEGDQ